MKTSLKKLVLRGEEIDLLLQRIITQDINICRTPRLSALCNPEGKVLYTFWIQKTDDILIWADKSIVTGLLKTLREYDPFCQLSFHLENASIWATEDLNFQSTETHSVTTWGLFLIQQGIITITPETQGKYSPQMLNLDTLEAICLTKGCFVGYEHVARIQFRGKTKRRLSLQHSKENIPSALNAIKHNNQYFSLVLNSTQLT